MTRFSNDYHHHHGGGNGGEVSMSEKFLHATRKTPASASMLSSAKFRFREDRKRVLKLSVRKLRDIEDPETFLCRSVLINNTMKRLQQEVREEKKSYNACKSYTPSPAYSYFSVERAYREEMERVHSAQDEASNRRLMSVDNDDDDVASSPSSSSSSSSSTSSGSSDEEDEDKDSNSRRVVVDDDVDDLLSEVYMPPSITPPTMISSIDDDDLTTYPSSDDSSPETKDTPAELCWPDRPSTPIPWASVTSGCTERSCDIWCSHLWSGTTTSTTSAPSTTTTTATMSVSATSSPSSSSSTSCDSSFLSSSSTTTSFSPSSPSSWSNYSELSPSSSSLSSCCNASPAASTSSTTTFTSTSYSICGGASYLSDKGLADKHYSCGQSSLFGELQSVVFNSLIASLET